MSTYFQHNNQDQNTQNNNSGNKRPLRLNRKQIRESHVNYRDSKHTQDEARKALSGVLADVQKSSDTSSSNKRPHRRKASIAFDAQKQREARQALTASTPRKRRGKRGKRIYRAEGAVSAVEPQQHTPLVSSNIQAEREQGEKEKSGPRFPVYVGEEDALQNPHVGERGQDVITHSMIRKNPHQGERQPWKESQIEVPEDNLSTARTFKADAVETIKENNESVVSIREKERTRLRKRGEPDLPMRVPVSQRSLGKTIIIIIGVVLSALALGALAGAGYYYVKTGVMSSFSLSGLRSDGDTVPEETKERPIVVEVNSFNIANKTKEDVIALMEVYVTRPVAQGTVERIEVFNGNDIAQAREFLSALDVRASGEFLRALGDDFVLGVYGGEDGNHVFLALEVDSFPQAFAGVLGWESTMVSDLGTFLYGVAPGVVGTFNDGVMNGIDVRTIGGADKTPVLTYAFVNQNALVITTTPVALVDIMTTFKTQQGSE